MQNSARRFFLPVVLTAACLFILTAAATAQTRTIRGKVTDDKGQPVADAKIFILGIDSATSLSAKTNKKGEYIYLLGLQGGIYRVVVRKEGFQPDVKENVQPNLEEAYVVDFKLSPGSDHKLPFEMSAKDKAESQKSRDEGQKTDQIKGELLAAYRLGVQLTGEGKYDEALVELNKALEKAPSHPTIHLAIGNAYAKAGKNEEALAAYNKAISFNPNDPDLYTTAAIVMNALGKTADAQEAFKKAAALKPEAAAQNYYNLGVLFMNSNKIDEAADAFKQSIAADQSFGESYYQLGMALSGKQTTIPAAIDAMKKYIEIGKKPEQVEVAKQIIQALGGK
jgi:tetratricopeptide (TPR) repeat protein